MSAELAGISKIAEIVNVNRNMVVTPNSTVSQATDYAVTTPLTPVSFSALRDILTPVTNARSPV